MDLSVFNASVAIDTIVFENCGLPIPMPEGESCGEDTWQCKNRACIEMDHLCDGSDDCGDESDENFKSNDGLCKNYTINNFEDDSSLGMFMQPSDSKLKWVRATVDYRAFGKTPNFDHTTFDYIGHFLHVGGLEPKIDGDKSGLVSGVLLSPVFKRSQEQEDPFMCKVVFYAFHLGMKEEIGKLQFFLQKRLSCV